METAIFIYAKDGKIKALPLLEAKTQHENLINSGYTHTASIEICRWIEHLHNNCNDVNEEVKSLGIAPF